MTERPPDTGTCTRCGQPWEEHDLVLHEEGQICVLCEVEIQHAWRALQPAMLLGPLVGLAPTALALLGTWRSWWWQNWVRPDRLPAGMQSLSPQVEGVLLGVGGAMLGLLATYWCRRTLRWLAQVRDISEARDRARWLLPLWRAGLALAALSIPLGIAGPLGARHAWPLEDLVLVKVGPRDVENLDAVPWFRGEALERRGGHWLLPRPEPQEGVLLLSDQGATASCCCTESRPHETEWIVHWYPWSVPIVGLPPEERVFVRNERCWVELVRDARGVLLLPKVMPGFDETLDITLGAPRVVEPGACSGRLPVSTGTVPTPQPGVLYMYGRGGSIRLDEDTRDQDQVSVQWEVPDRTSPSR